jgi:acetoin utilization protein AcuB
MLASELIDPMIPALKPVDTVGQALDWMQEHRVGQLAVVDQGEYKGLVNEDMLMDVPDEERPLSEVMRMFEHIYVHDKQHLYELLTLILEHRMQVLAVVSEAREFLGTVSTSELLKQFAQLLGVQEAGAILVLSINERDYSMAEISRLIESNNIRIIGSHFSGATYGTPDRSHLTLKLNRKDITAVVATLERFGYTVEAAFANTPIESIDQERLDLLLRYLDT